MMEREWHQVVVDVPGSHQVSAMDRTISASETNQFVSERLRAVARALDFVAVLPIGHAGTWTRDDLHGA